MNINLPGKVIFITLLCGYPSLVFPATVYDLLGGNGGGRSYVSKGKTSIHDVPITFTQSLLIKLPVFL